LHHAKKVWDRSPCGFDRVAAGRQRSRPRWRGREWRGERRSRRKCGGRTDRRRGWWSRRRGLLGVDQEPRFRDFALREHRSAFRYDEQLVPGARLPLTGVTYYAVPPEYGVDARYRYTIVNDHAVLVDPATRRIVQVID
jgi:hypothetical protein